MPALRGGGQQTARQHQRGAVRHAAAAQRAPRTRARAHVHREHLLRHFVRALARDRRRRLGGGDEGVGGGCAGRQGGLLLGYLERLFLGGVPECLTPRVAVSAGGAATLTRPMRRTGTGTGNGTGTGTGTGTGGRQAQAALGLRGCGSAALQRAAALLPVEQQVSVLGSWVKPCGARLEIRTRGKGAVHLPKILVLTHRPTRAAPYVARVFHGAWVVHVLRKKSNNMW